MPRIASRRQPVRLLAACGASTKPAPSSVPPLLDRAEQLVVVTTPAWDSTSGTLRRFVAGERRRRVACRRARRRRSSSDAPVSRGAAASTRRRSTRRRRTSTRATVARRPACFRSIPRSGSRPRTRRTGFDCRTSSSPPALTASTTRCRCTTTPSSIARRCRSTGRAPST